jgi:hypothetical protein
MSKSAQRYLDEFGYDDGLGEDYASPYDIATDHPNWYHAMGVAFYALHMVMTEQNGLDDTHTFREIHTAAIELSVESIMNESLITKDKAYLALGYPVEDMPKDMFDDDFPLPF